MTTSVVDAAMQSLVDSLSSSSPVTVTIELGVRLSAEDAHHLAARMPGPRMIMVAAEDDGLVALCSGVASPVVRAPSSMTDLAAACATATTPMVVTIPFDVERAPAGTVLGYRPRLCLWQPRQGLARLSVAVDDDREQTVSSLRSWLAPARASVASSHPLVWRHNLDEQQHAAKIESLLRAMRSGIVHKVISARTTTATLTIDAVHTLRQLHELEPTTTAFLIDHIDGPSSTWLGASPEWLCRRHGREVDIDVLAGTIGRDGNDDATIASLRNSDKDHAEHAFVGDDIRAVLAPLTERMEIDPVPSIKQLRHVHHLHRRLHATLNIAAPLFPHLHPTSAVCGTPTAAAMALIRSNEPDRGMYAGAVGIAMADGEDIAVALRCAHVASNTVTLHAGGGIVLGSDAALEWQELNHKVASLQDVLGGA